jgi:von Willebrand factor type A C-terminal domain/von Willebrand factor type A domain
MTSFNVDVDQNEFIPIDGSKVNAVITVESTSDGTPIQGPDAAEIVIVDTSGSMTVPRSKIKAAREATSVAIDCIRDGVAFGVIAGSEKAELVYPKTQALVPASPSTRNAAKEAAARLEAEGGTAIGSWLMLARWLFGSKRDGNCHTILLTDGANEHETPEELAAALSACEGHFQCDCRGVGTDWVVSELKGIASTLLGTAEIIPEPADMATDFRSTMEAAMGKTTGKVSLRLWTPQGAEVALVQQVFPTIEELTDRGAELNAQTADYPTGTWGTESREYHVCINVPPRGVGDNMLAARVSLVAGDEVLGQGLVKATWTDDEQLSTRISLKVAHYTGQAELAGCIQDGISAREAGDEATAQVKLGRAVQLASESGNEGTLKLLQRVVDVQDAATGTVRLRRDVADVDEMTLDTRSTKTIRARPPS